MVYQWKPKSMIKADANSAGKMCEQLENTIGLTPENLLDANRAKDSPLHNEFEWDDSIAAEKYRINQAGHIIRSLCVKIETVEKSNPEPVRAFFKLDTAESYESTTVIVKSISKYDELMAQARKELEAYLKKYSQIAELEPVRIFAVSFLQSEVSRKEK